MCFVQLFIWLFMVVGLLRDLVALKIPGVAGYVRLSVSGGEEGCEKYRVFNLSFKCC